MALMRQRTKEFTLPWNVAALYPVRGGQNQYIEGQLFCAGTQQPRCTLPCLIRLWRALVL